MAKVAGPLIDLVLARVRDPQGSSHPRSLVLGLLSDLQCTLNAAYEDVMATTTFTLTQRQCFYQTSALIPDAIRIKQVKTTGGEYLEKMPLEEMRAAQPQWFRYMAAQPACYGLYGEDGLVVWPAVDTSASVDITYVKIPTVLAVEGDSTEIADEHVETLLQMVELFLLLRVRDKESAAAKMEEVTTRVKAGL